MPTPMTATQVEAFADIHLRPSTKGKSVTNALKSNLLLRVASYNKKSFMTFALDDNSHNFDLKWLQILK